MFKHQEPSARDLSRKRLAIADREERVAATVHHECRCRELGQALAPARRAVELGEDRAHLVGHLDRGQCPRRAVEDALGGRTCRGGFVAPEQCAGGGELRHGSTIGPIGHREGEHPLHRRPSWSGRSSSTRPCATGRVPASVSPQTRPADRARRPGRPSRRRRCPPGVPADRRVRGRGRRRRRRGRAACTPAPRVDGRRRAGVAQVVAHDVASAAGKGSAERVGPGEHGWAAREHHEGRCRIAEVLDAEPDAVTHAKRTDRRMHRLSSIRWDSALYVAPP